MYKDAMIIYKILVYIGVFQFHCHAIYKNTSTLIYYQLLYLLSMWRQWEVAIENPNKTLGLQSINLQLQKCPYL